MLLEIETEKSNLTKEERFKLDKIRQYELSHFQYKLRQKTKPSPENYVTRMRNCTIKKIFRNLKHDKYEVNVKLKVALGAMHVQAFNQHLAQLNSHIACQNRLEENTKNVKIQISHLKSQLIRIDKKEYELANNTPNDREYIEQLEKSQKKLNALEMNANVSKMKEGQVTAENTRLTATIHTMLHERALFNRTWHKIVKQLHHDRRFLVDLIERAILAFNQNEDYVHKIMNLTKKSDQDKAIHIKDILEMRRKLDAAEIYHNFLEVKGNYRDMQDLDDKEVRRRKFVKNELSYKLELYQNIIQKVIERFSSVETIASSDVLNTDETQVMSEEDTDSIIALRLAAKIEQAKKDAEQALLEKLKEIIDEYVLNLKQYRAHFNYLNQINLQYQLLEQRFSEYIPIIIKRSNKSKERNTQVSNDVKTIYDQLTLARFETDEARKKWEDNEDYLESILMEIHDIFKSTNCDTRHMRQLLGDHTKVNLFNIKLFLRTLENRLNSMLSYIYYKEQKSPGAQKFIKIHRKKPFVAKLSNVVPTHQCSECAEREDVNRYDETVVYPRNKKEIKDTVKEKVLTPEMQYRIHNLSQCRLPRSRILVNKRYM